MTIEQGPIAAHYTPGRQGHKIQILVLHSAENQELPGQAKHLAQWFAGSTAPLASAGEMIDNTETVISVPDASTPWAVDDFPLNLISKSYELTGHASNTAAQWKDAYEVSVIKNAIADVKADRKKYGIPPTHLTDSQILAAHRGNTSIKGICTHADITRALHIAGGHTDPGPNFDVVNFIKALS